MSTWLAISRNKPHLYMLASAPKAPFFDHGGVWLTNVFYAEEPAVFEERFPEFKMKPGDDPIEVVVGGISDIARVFSKLPPEHQPKGPT